VVELKYVQSDQNFRDLQRGIGFEYHSKNFPKKSQIKLRIMVRFMAKLKPSWDTEASRWRGVSTPQFHVPYPVGIVLR
jgi:hypothetical protein